MKTYFTLKMSDGEDWVARAWELIGKDDADGLKEIVPSKVRVNQRVFCCSNVSAIIHALFSGQSKYSRFGAFIIS